MHINPNLDFVYINAYAKLGQFNPSSGSRDIEWKENSDIYDLSSLRSLNPL